LTNCLILINITIFSETGQNFTDKQCGSLLITNFKLMKYALNKTEIGMIINEDILSPMKGILYKKGTVIDQRVQQNLKKHKIDFVDIKIVAKESDPERTDSRKTVAPEISVTVSLDKMTACLNIIPPEIDDSTDIELEKIEQIIQQEGIRFGINKEAIYKYVKDYNAVKVKMVSLVVAEGKPALPRTEGQVVFSKKIYKDSSILGKLRKEPAVYHYMVEEVLPHYEYVKKDDIIGHRETVRPEEKGFDVFGTVLQPGEVVREDIKMGAMIRPAPDLLSFKALTSGMIVLEENQYDVLPIHFDGKVHLELANKDLTVLMNLYPAGELGKDVEFNEIVNQLHALRVVYGVLEEDIRKFILQSRSERTPLLGVVVAQGKNPVPGKDAVCDFLFRNDSSLAPQVRDDGTVDFYNVNLIENVVENQELMRLIPPTLGQEGITVLGKSIPASNGKPGKLPLGLNTKVDPNDPNVLLATTGGSVRLNGNLVEVSDNYVIKGDVDFSTGNVTYIRSIFINGDVKSGFEVHAGEDVEIKGIVEDAKLEVGGDLLIRKGFTGSGKGQIDCKGNVFLGFVRNQSIKSKQDVTIANEAINSQIKAKNKIEIKGKTLSAVGGHLTAKNEIIANVVGNENGTRTELEVGTDFILLEEQIKTDQKIRELTENRKKVEENIGKLEHMRQVKKALPPKQDFLLKKLSSMGQKIIAQLEALEKRKKIIEEKLKEVNKSRIRILSKAWSGTHIKIRDRQMILVKDIIGPKSILLIDDEIKIV